MQHNIEPKNCKDKIHMVFIDRWSSLSAGIFYVSFILSPVLCSALSPVRHFDSMATQSISLQSIPDPSPVSSSVHPLHGICALC